MTIYADYSFYKDVYKGTMSEDDFVRLSVRASVHLDAITSGRIAGDLITSENVKSAMCAIADALIDNERSGIVAAESNDGVSITYVQGAEKRRLAAAASLYLCNTDDAAGVPLLYRGG